MRRAGSVAFALWLALAPLQPGLAAAAPAPGKEPVVNLAFVLLARPTAPKGEEIERAFAAFAVKGQQLHFRPGKARKTSAADPLEFALGAGGTAFVALTPEPVPHHEAEDAVRYSVSALEGRWKLPEHKAHLVVTSRESAQTAETLSAFTSLVAAVSRSSSAVGIYCGGAGATHDPKFFESIALERDTKSRLVLWNGVAIAHAPEGRLSLLSLGMKQLDLPDLLLLIPEAKGDEALGMAFDLLGYVVHSGKAVPEGATVGRTASEKMPVHYIRSPVDPKAQVWMVEAK
jgi:Domain of unknown function (DUF4261)